MELSHEMKQPGFLSLQNVSVNVLQVESLLVHSISRSGKRRIYTQNKEPERRKASFCWAEIHGGAGGSRQRRRACLHGSAERGASSWDYIKRDRADEPVYDRQVADKQQAQETGNLGSLQHEARPGWFWPYRTIPDSSIIPSLCSSSSSCSSRASSSPSLVMATALSPVVPLGGFALSRSHRRPHINTQAGGSELNKSLLCNLSGAACCSLGPVRFGPARFGSSRHPGES